MCMGRKREMLKSKNRSVCFLQRGGGPGTQESLSAQWLHSQTSGGKTVHAGHVFCRSEHNQELWSRPT